MNIFTLTYLYFYVDILTCTIDESDIMKLKIAKDIVGYYRDAEPLLQMKETYEKICHNIIIYNQNFYNMNSCIKYSELTIKEKEWISMFFDIVYVSFIYGYQNKNDLFDIINKNMFSLTFINDTKLINELITIFDFIFLDWNHLNRNCQFNYYLPNDLKNLFKRKFSDSLENCLILEKKVSPCYTAINNCINSYHLFFIMISAFIFSTSSINYTEYFDKDSLTKYLSHIYFSTICQTLKLKIIYNIFISINIKPHQLILPLCSRNRNLSDFFIHKILTSDVLKSDLDIIKVIINIKTNKIEDCIEIKTLISFYIENADLRTHIFIFYNTTKIGFFDVCFQQLFSNTEITDNFQTRLSILEYFNMRLIDELNLLLINSYIKQLIRNICHFNNKLLIEDDTEDKINHLNNLLNITFKIITETHSINCRQPLYDLDTIRQTYVNTNYGLKFKHTVFNFLAYNIPLEIEELSDGRFIIDFERTYLLLMSFEFARGTMNTPLNEISNSFLKFISLKLILRDKLNELELFISREFYYISSENINALYNFSDENPLWNDVLNECLSRAFYFIHNVPLEKYFLRNNDVNISFNEDFYVTLYVGGDSVFDQSLKEMEIKISRNCDRTSTKKEIKVVDKSKGRGHGVVSNWIQNIAKECIKYNTRYLFILQNIQEHIYIPCILSDIAFQRKQKEYKFIGQMIGMALISQFLFDVEFAYFIYDILLHRCVDLETLIENEFKYIFENIGENSNYEESFQLYVIDYFDDKFELNTINIITKEDILYLKNIPDQDIHKEIKAILIRKISNYLIRPVLKMRDGLSELIDIGIFSSSLNNTSEFKNIIFGDSNIEVGKWKSITSIVAETDQAKKTLELFWQFIENANMAYRKEILKFWTGYANFPKLNNSNDQPFKLEIISKNPNKPNVIATVCFKTMQMQIVEDIKDFSLYFGDLDAVQNESGNFNME